MNMSMEGVSHMHACMHATCNTHTYTWTHATLMHPGGTQHTMQHARSPSSAQPTPYAREKNETNPRANPRWHFFIGETPQAPRIEPELELGCAGSNLSCPANGSTPYSIHL